MSENYWRIRNANDGEAVIEIYEFIGQDFFDEGMGAKRFARELKDLGDIERLTVRINSPGGSVFEGNAIYNILRTHPAAVTVYVDGLAGSIASVIAMAGDTIVMPENAMMMIHDPSGFVMGTADDMRDMAEAMDKVKSTVIAAYREKTGLEDDALARLMQAESWFTATEALELGFADQIDEPMRAAAVARMQAFDYSPYRHAPTWLSSTAGHPGAHSGGQSMTTNSTAAPVTLALIKAEHPDIVSALHSEGADLIVIDQATIEDKYPDIAAALRDAGAAGECERIQSVRTQAAGIAGHEDLVAEMMFDGKTTGPEAAVRILAAEKAAREAQLTDIQSDAAVLDGKAPGAAAPEGATDRSRLPLEERCKAEWDESPELRAEYRDNFQSYLAYSKAEAKGSVRFSSAKR